jgi:hypothetical protein
MRPDFPTTTVALDDRVPPRSDAVPRPHHRAWIPCAGCATPLTNRGVGRCRSSVDGGCGVGNEACQATGSAEVPPTAARVIGVRSAGGCRRAMPRMEWSAISVIGWIGLPWSHRLKGIFTPSYRWQGEPTAVNQPRHSFCFCKEYLSTLSIPGAFSMARGQFCGGWAHYLPWNAYRKKAAGHLETSDCN